MEIMTINTNLSKKLNLLFSIEDKWTAKIGNLKLKKSKLSELIDALYKLCGLSDPKIICARSPLEAQALANSMLNDRQDHAWAISHRLQADVYKKIGYPSMAICHEWLGKSNIRDFSLETRFIYLVDSSYKRFNRLLELVANTLYHEIEKKGSP